MAVRPTLILAGVVTLVSIVLMIMLGRLRRLTSGTLLIGAAVYAAFLTTVLVSADRRAGAGARRARPAGTATVGGRR